MTGVDDLFLVHTVLYGRPVELILRLALYADVAWIMEGAPPAGEQVTRLLQWLSAEVAVADHADMTVDQAGRLIGDGHLLGDFVSARHRLYVDAGRVGLLFARCPHCREAEAEISTAALEFGLGAPPPAVSTPDGVWPEPPAIGAAETLVPGRRVGDPPVAAGLRVELPTYRLGLGAALRPRGAVLRRLDAAAEAAAWRRHWPEGSFMPQGRPWWYAENSAFRAIVRLSGAVAKLTDGGPAGATPRSLEKLPAVDIAYLDHVIMATQFTDQPVDVPARPGLVGWPARAAVTCKACAGRFLPMF